MTAVLQGGTAFPLLKQCGSFDPEQTRCETCYVSKISSLTSTLTKPRVWAPTGRGDVPHEVRTDVCVYYHSTYYKAVRVWGRGNKESMC